MAYPALEGNALPELDHEVLVCYASEDKPRFVELPVGALSGRGMAAGDARFHGG